MTETGRSEATGAALDASTIGEGGGTEPSPPPRLGSTSALVVKLIVLLFVNAVVLWAIGVMATEDKVAWAIACGVALAVLDVLYLSRRRFVPGKYLYPGTVFLLLFAVYPVGYNVFISFTNYGTGNNLSKAQAVEIIERNSVQPPSDESPRYRLQIMAEGDPDTGQLAYFLTADDGTQLFGTLDGTEPVDPGAVTLDGERVTSYGDYLALNLRQAQDRSDEIGEFSVPGADEGTAILNEGFTTARVTLQRLVFDSATNTITDVTTGTVYTEQDGRFTAISDDGTEAVLQPGWRAVIGTANYERIYEDDTLREAFSRTFVWTFAFSILSVLTTFALGLLLAIVFNDERMRGRRVYRALIIIPYALPSFMTALVWRGMLNESFGIINRTLDWSVPWLTGTNGADKLWPYFSILLVNLWLGYPYMFLVSTGALQSIPGDLKEAAFVDGATGFKAFRRVTFPLLLTSVAPLLISSFAFNFNNFNLIYLLTNGDPPVSGTPIGRTDIMITAAWKVAFGGNRGADYGLAAAISVIIFVIVAIISAISFRFTRSFEEVK